LAAKLGIDPRRVLVTAGGDDAIDRACRAVLEPGRCVVLPTPTFEMIERSATLAGAQVVRLSWPGGAYPRQAVLDSIDDRTGMIAVVTPNNPTGAVASKDDLRSLSAAAPGVLLLVDLAYTEFADEDLTEAAAALPNALIVRTFSKAFGLAGLRVGYAIGAVAVIRAMRAMGSPFPVAGACLRAAASALEAASSILPRACERVRVERQELARTIADLGARSTPSQANFVLAEFNDAEWVWRALASLGISVRRFGAESGLPRSLRITCPGCPASFDRLCKALKAVLRPRALLLDMDGVLADVSKSYRRAIALTAESYGVALTATEIGRAKAAPDANNDWVVTQRLLGSRGVSAPLAEVTERFESLYQGGAGRPGLRESETLIPSRRLLERLAARTTLGIVTGRPRPDCERFLGRHGITDLFRAVVCMEDSAHKPDPAPVRLALDRLGVESAWLVGDTPDDIAAARGAGVVPIGVAAPGENPDTSRRLTESGAALVLESLHPLQEMLR
jgi:histidinol-phosphate aminotransferase